MSLAAPVEPASVVIVRHVDGIRSVADEWERLWRDQPRREVFQHPEWCAVWTEAYELSDAVRVLLVRDGAGVLRAVLPLVAAADVLGFCCAPRSEYNDIVCAPADVDFVRGPLVVALQSDRGNGWTRIELRDVREDAVLQHVLDERTRDALRLVRRAGSVCPSAVLDDAGAEHVRSRVADKRMRQTRRRFERLGSTEFAEVSGGEERLAAVRRLFDQHVSRWSWSGKTSQFTDERCRDLYERLATIPSLSPYVRLDELRLDGESVAVHFGWQIDGRVLYYKPSYSLNCRRHSPGKLLLVGIVERALAEEAVEVDLCRGDEGYKSQFATTSRRNDTFESLHGPFESALRRIRESSTARRLGRIARDPLGSFARYRRRRRPTQDRSECLVFRTDGVSDLTDDRDDIVLEIGPVDLVTFGADARWNPGYVTARRLRSAEKRRDRGDRLLVARDSESGRPLHYIWLHFSDGIVDMPEAGGELALEDAPCVLLQDAWTSTHARGRGVYVTALRAASTYAHERGRAAWGYCLLSNVPSRVGLIRAEMQFAFRVRSDGTHRTTDPPPPIPPRPRSSRPAGSRSTAK